MALWSQPGELDLPRKILTPKGLCDLLQDHFDQSLGPVWLAGEIASLARPASGHAYFALKDAQALVKAVAWKSRIPRLGGPLENGLSVLAKGTLAVYAPRGEWQLIVERLEPQGAGALRQAYEKLFKRLGAEGLFNPERKRPRPFWPRRLALLTAAGGAARQDFLATALKRCPSAAIAFYPVRVQGAGAAEEIAEALADLNQWGGFDLAVVTRGGGSLEDLWAFNEEVLVRAVAASRLPVLAAIGHSTDESLVELAADGRAITPTAAAEAAFPDLRVLAEGLTGQRRRLLAGLAASLGRSQTRLRSLTNRLSRFETQARLRRQALDNLTASLAKAGRRCLGLARLSLESLVKHLAYRSPAQALKRDWTGLAALARSLPQAYGRQLTDRRQGLLALKDRLSLVSPLGVLSRGYALVLAADGQILRSATQAAPGDLIRARLAQGGLTARVVEIWSKKPSGLAPDSAPAQAPPKGPGL
ncbi:MAG: exodeoxyribonuclease VII large subunit [Deltaproteobacteria bacterium]|jgi:exodeoxyribonuclease VII large subunit|nr:exodeoxyribonuclease VII large subunit [Deltaproteobacteria bacterium]